MIAEMVDGAVVLSPSPGFGHSDMVLALAGVLRAAAPADLRVLAAPFPVRLGRRTELRPDLLVARYLDLTRDGLTAPPLLAVEVAAPGGELLDRTVKRVVYARHGIAGYWLLDPETPALTALNQHAADPATSGSAPWRWAAGCGRAEPLVAGSAACWFTPGT